MLYDRFLIGVAVAVLGTVAWAMFAYSRIERAHRSAWVSDEIDAGDVPYRSSRRVRAVRAPRLVRTTAFMCLWVGQLVAAVMVVPAFFMRPFSTSMSAGKPGSMVSSAMLTYSLGSKLLECDALTEAQSMATRPVLHTVAGALVVFSAFGFAKGTAPAFFGVLGIVAFAMLVVSAMLARTMHSCGVAFRVPPMPSE